MLSTILCSARQEKDVISIMPKVEANVSRFNYGDWRTGFVGGVEGSYKLSNYFAVSAGALFSMQGAKIKSSFMDYYRYNPYQYDPGKGIIEQMGYLNIPATVNIYIIKGLAFKTGAQVGFKLYDNTREDLPIIMDASFKDPSEGNKKVDLSIPVGVSYEIGRVVFDARYNIGINDFAPDTKSGGIPEKSRRHKVFQFTVGYKFGIK